MTAQPTLVVALIPTRNRSASVLRLLDALAGQRGLEAVELRTIVWDDGSTPEHRRRLRASPHAGAPGVTIREGAGRERMRVKRRLDELALETTEVDARAGREVLVAHLDDDVLPAPTWLTTALDAVRRHGWAACGSVERVADGWVLSGQSRLATTVVATDVGDVRVWDWQREPVAQDDHDGATEVVFAGHRAMLVRLRAVADVPHDPDLTIGGEDLDWSLSLTRAGHRIGIAHGARIEHRAHGEDDDHGFRDPAEVLASWRRFYARWGLVRRGAASEAGLDVDAWLRAVAAPG